MSQDHGWWRSAPSPAVHTSTRGGRPGSARRPASAKNHRRWRPSAGPQAGGITGVVSRPGPDGHRHVEPCAPGVIGVASWLPPGSGRGCGSRAHRARRARHELTTATAAAADRGSKRVIGGLATTFRAGIVHQQATALGVPGPRTAGPGFDLDSSDKDSAATDVSCAAGSCLAVGRLGDRLAAWRVAVGEPRWSPASRISRSSARPLHRPTQGRRRCHRRRHRPGNVG